VYCAKTYEENICILIQDKIANIKGINDGDLTGIKIPVEDMKIIEENIKKSNDDEIIGESSEKDEKDEKDDKIIESIKNKNLFKPINREKDRNVNDEKIKKLPKEKRPKGNYKNFNKREDFNIMDSHEANEIYKKFDNK
jgi:hypothetical protein